MLNKNPVISLIVPIYNSQEYLPLLFKDIESQTFTDFECILVNDGSTDSSLDLCNAQAVKDSRFIVLDGPNQGISRARNKGLGVIRGSLIGFIDSDDRIADTYLESLKKGIDQGGDVSVCRYRSVFTHSRFPVIGNPSVTVSDNSVAHYFSDSHIGLIAGNYCWGKLYKRELIGDLKFVEIDSCGNEDYCFAFEIAKRAEKIAYVSSKLYFYYLRFGSFSANKNKLKKNIPLSINTLISSCKTLDENSDDFKELTPYVFQNISLYHLQALTKGLIFDEDFNRSLAALIPEMDRIYELWKLNKGRLRFAHRYFYGALYSVLSAHERNNPRKK